MPGEFIEKTSENIEPAVFIRELQGHFRQLRPAEVKRHGEIKSLIFKDLKTTDYVLLFCGPKRNSLHMPYEGPYKVTVEVVEVQLIYLSKTKFQTVSIDLLKPAYVINDILPEDNNETP